MNTKSFPLPIGSNLSEIAWLQKSTIGNLLEATPLEVHAQVESFWNAVKHDQLRSLADHILSFPPRAIVVHDDQAWIQMGNMVPSGHEGFLVRVPSFGSESFELQPAYSHDAHLLEVLSIFFTKFGGLRETMPPLAGYFFESPLPSVSELIDYDGIDLEHWINATPVFHALTGDILLVDMNGNTGWWLMEEQRIASFQRDILSAIGVFLELKRTHHEYNLFAAYEAYDLLGIREY